MGANFFKLDKKLLKYLLKYMVDEKFCVVIFLFLKVETCCFDKVHVKKQMLVLLQWGQSDKHTTRSQASLPQPYTSAKITKQ